MWTLKEVPVLRMAVLEGLWGSEGFWDVGPRLEMQVEARVSSATVEH